MILKNTLRLALMIAPILLVSLHLNGAAVTFTQLPGLTGGSPAETATYRANLDGLGLVNLLSITIADSNSGSGGSGGSFSGFDLDGIKLSNTFCADAACVAALPGIAAFNFSNSGVVFNPGTQRAPAGPNLFGATPGGLVDFPVATLGAFDANSTTGATAFGFLSLGDGGQISFNLTGPVDIDELYLYIGEVGDNGEVAAGSVTISDTPIPGVPEPSTYALLGSGLLAFALARRRK